MLEEVPRQRWRSCSARQYSNDRISQPNAAGAITRKRPGCSAAQYRTIAGKQLERLTGPMHGSFKPRSDAEREPEKEEF
jgi:hypothetical protein